MNYCHKTGSKIHTSCGHSIIIFRFTQFIATRSHRAYMGLYLKNYFVHI
jgi:hypothetical protein